MSNYRIVRLQAENIKRIEAVDITPNGDVVIVAGKNGQGKTSVLDSITMALGGKDLVPAEPLRHGAHKGQVTLDCGDFTATRKFSETGQQLILKRKNGQPITEKPQTFLDNLIGSLSFDPLEFSRLKAGERLNTLLGLTNGLEVQLKEIAAKREKAFTERTEYNVTVRNLNGQLAEMEAPTKDWPEGEVSLDSFTERRKALQLEIDRNRMTRDQLAMAETAVTDAEEEMHRLARLLDEAKFNHQKATVEVVGLRCQAERLVDPDLSTVDGEMAAAIERNKLAVKRQEYSKTLSKKCQAITRAEALTEIIEACDAMKANALAEANLPIPGLEFSDGDVRYNGVLFDQLSGAEQLRVSLSMAMAANPDMRVIRITNGSLLDDDNMEIVRQMAGEHDYQVWIECVGDRKDATVVIEEGKVKK
jgi:hypothetical protein